MIGRMSPQVRPSGTVSLLFTDIEGSTSLWERDPDGMRRALARHDERSDTQSAPSARANTTWVRVRPGR